MKAFISIKYHPDNRNRDHIEQIASALEANGFQTVCVVRDVEQWGHIHLSPQELMARTFDEIDSSDVVVIDLTEKGVGLGIEAGYAYAKGVPVVAIARKGSDISATLRGISRQVFWYAGWDALRLVIRQIS